MIRRSDKIQLLFLFLAFALGFAGLKLGLPVLFNLGGMSLGAFALTAGLQAMVVKRVGFETQRPNFGRRSLYTGLSAQLLGLLFIAFALLIFLAVGVAWFYPGGAEKLWALILGSTWGWGILLLGIGLAVLINGVVTLISGSAGYYQGLADLAERIGGLIPFSIGLLLSLLGLALLAVPHLLLGFAHLLLVILQRWIFH